MHLVFPTKFCTTIAFDFSWDDCTQEKLETMFMPFFVGGGGGGINKVYYGLCENGEFSTKTTELAQPRPQRFPGSDFFWW